MPRPSLNATQRDWLSPHRLEYVRLDEELAVVRVLAGLGRGQQPPADAALVAGAPHSIVRAPVLGSVTHRPARRLRTADHLLWRVTFALPLELVECPQTLFALTARDYLPTRLPGPTRSSFEALCRQWELGARGAGLLSAVAWRRAAAVGTAVAVAGTSVLPPAAAFASALHGSHRTNRARVVVRQAAPSRRPHVAHATVLATAAAPAAHPARTAAGSGDVAPARAAHSVSVPRPGNGGQSGHADPKRLAISRHHAHQMRIDRASAPASAPTRAASAPAQSPVGPSDAVGPQPVGDSLVTQGAIHRHHRHPVTAIQLPSQGGGSDVATISPTAPVSLISGQGASDPRAARHHSHHHRGSGPANERHHHHRRAGAGHGKRSSFSGGTGLPKLSPTPPRHHTRPEAPEPQPVVSVSSSSSTNSVWAPGTGLSPAEVALLGHLSGIFNKGLAPPAFLVPIYKKAGQRFHIPWQVLAAINSIETNYGRDLHVSSAGAEGWMQFMPSTWAEYGISVGGHGTPNPYDPTDAIFSAAHYLAVNGGGRHLRKAIFAYNHAQWYVDAVMWRAQQILEHTARPNASAKTKIADMLTAARLLNGLPYVYGGGHASWGPSIGYDCSGFVSAVLHAAGYLSGPQDTQTLPDQPGILPGPGKWVTMFDRTDGGSLSEDHVIIDIDGQFWESGGSTSDGGAAQVHRIAHISLGYLATFNRILHPRGL